MGEMFPSNKRAEENFRKINMVYYKNKKVRSKIESHWTQSLQTKTNIVKDKIKELTKC